MIDAERVKQTFLDLVSINSPSRGERGVADYVKARLASMGFEVEEDDAGAKIDGNCGNVIAFLPGTTPDATPIFLSCHMDTVEPTENLRLVFDGDTIRTDGSTILGADDKAGITAVLEGVAEALKLNVPRGDLQVMFSISEEQGLRGAREMDHGKIRAKMGYVFDTERPVAGLTVSAPTHEYMSIEIHGQAAHAGIAPEKGVSAIVAASNAISKMKLGRIDAETTANIGKIEGGKARNIVPDLVTVSAEARSRDNDKLDEQVRHMTTLFEQEAQKIGARAIVTMTRQYSTYRWTAEDEVVKLAATASRRIGIEPVLVEGGGGSDANIYNSVGIPALVIGTGYSGAHSTIEETTVPELAKSAEFVVALIECAAQTSV
jgi:tripeptide aminopeptidase